MYKDNNNHNSLGSDTWEPIRQLYISSTFLIKVLCKNKRGKDSVTTSELKGKRQALNSTGTEFEAIFRAATQTRWCMLFPWGVSRGEEQGPNVGQSLHITCYDHLIGKQVTKCVVLGSESERREMMRAGIQIQIVSISG